MKFGVYTLVIENFLKKTIFDYKFDYGWGNGYVLLPHNHPFYGIDYDDINVNVHGGLTYGKKFESEHFLEWVEGREIDGDVTIENYKKFNGYWIIGFDTNHFGDNENNCTKNYVMNETNHLMNKCLDKNIKGMNRYLSIYFRKDKLIKINASVLALSSKQDVHNGNENVGSSPI